MTVTEPAPDHRARRIHDLDALRGLALAGITMVNIVQITGMPEARGEARDHPGAYVFELLFFQRPFLVFSLLFGVSFAIFLRTAGSRTGRPRLVLLRRLLALGVLGALHTLLQPGEVLKFYAVAGIVVLLPASYLSRRWVWWLGVVLTLAGALTFSGVSLIPGLFLLGMAAARYDVPDTLDRRGRQLAWACGIGVLLSIGAAVLQYRAGVGPTAHFRSAPMGLIIAFTGMTGFLLLLRTRARRPLVAVLAPMGRTALTNYILATLLILAADRVWHFGDRTDYLRVVLAGLAIGVVQAVLSPLWLSRFRYGPLEWLWRCVTWWQRVPLRQSAVSGGRPRSRVAAPGSPG
jgi:uncharacterized membrane protein YeiB